ncbi:protein-export membrane protein SecG [mine drainage metagenome]|uniref:Protein-export membrane protein SecG n=1 Tax=mine drainage metagenome TaxID=410659 RepID=A0A1J5QL27_9ZZZZ
METIVWVIHVIAAASVIGLVLLQHGKGADMGAGFGSGASGSLFGVSGSANLLSRATAAAVTVFFITSMSLAYLASHSSKHSSVIQERKKSGQLPAAAKPADSSKAQDVPQ